jgi:hypothetical protein
MALRDELSHPGFQKSADFPEIGRLDGVWILQSSRFPPNSTDLADKLAGNRPKIGFGAGHFFSFLLHRRFFKTFSHRMNFGWWLWASNF